MLRSLVAIALLLSFALTAFVVSAQESANPPVGQNSIGSPITFYSVTGDEAAQVTVLNFEDPFEDWAEYASPDRSERYILVEIQVDATGERPFEFAGYYFQLLDSLGHVYTLGYVSRSDASTVSQPELQDAVMLPGESITGFLSYRIPVVARVSQLIYTDYTDVQRLYLLADLTGLPPGGA